MQLLGLTIGDAAGVGPEVVLKAHLDPRVPEVARLAVFGSRQVFEYYIKKYSLPLQVTTIRKPSEASAAAKRVHVIETLEGIVDFAPGRVGRDAGKLAHASLLAGARAAAAGEIEALVTAPTNKTSLRAAGCDAEGQTELLGEFWGGGIYGMLVVAGALRILLLTRHMSLREALSRITTASTLDHLKLLNESLIKLGIEAPRIALAGLNPHAGEGGLFGREDLELLYPAASAARAAGLNVCDPLPADSLFGRAFRGEFDGVLALYHDQGLIAPKIVAHNTAVTVIAGAPHLRVSVIHGAGFDRAGQNRADATNMIEAIRRAAEWAPLWNRKSNI
ncbi:MAG: 4-hydroxythreonine-4-phosphate dehydrogenase PdxA [Planctomycetes bacterium]|nr:4-hydroxythreonine-4-phosphate dehydrogenase PdxA [Planctomycetota bacterium]